MLNITTGSNKTYSVGLIIKKALKAEYLSPGTQDFDGRLLSVKIGDTQIIEIYAPAGPRLRELREDFYNYDLPQSILLKKGLIVGDFNAVLRPTDATNNITTKLCPLLNRMIKIKNLKDVCTTLDPDSDVKTYTYEFEGLPHGSRLDMGLTWGLTPTKYEHFNTRMSDHKSILFSVDANDKDRELKAPESKKPDKMRPDIAKNKFFKAEAKRLVTAAAPGRQGTKIIDWWLDNVRETFK